MNVLYIGGTGEISYECVIASAAAGHRVTVFNRGRSDEPLPAGVRQVIGQLNDSTYEALGRERFDAVCQFLAYDAAQIQRDISIFGGGTGQYVFISTASAYQKPPVRWLITEDVPLANPFWPYSQTKADAEVFLRGQREKLPFTIVRPSHTYRRRFVSTFMAGDDHAWRMLQGRPVIVHGDGTGLWTYTHASDFATPFVRLLGNPRALGEAFHITRPDAYTWNEIFGTIARVLGVASPRFAYVPSRTIVRYNGEWAGPLLGDKGWSAAFDLTKLKGVVGDFECRVSLDEGMKRVLPYVQRRLASFTPDPRLHDLLDRMAKEQEGLGNPTSSRA